MGHVQASKILHHLVWNEPVAFYEVTGNLLIYELDVLYIFDIDI